MRRRIGCRPDTRTGPTPTAPPLPESLPRHCIPALLGLILFGAMALLYRAGSIRTYAAALHLMGAHFSDTPFMDVQGELAAIECHRRGFDVFVNNPCDVLGRSFNYSPVWLLGSHLPVDTSWTLAIGSGLDLVFLISLVLLPAARTTAGLLTVIAATLSNSLFVALEQANFDLLMFVLVLLAGLAAMQKSWGRIAAYPLIACAALLKFYPIVAMVVALRERPARFLLVSAVMLGCLVLFVLVDGHDVGRALRNLPLNGHLYMFGSRTLPYGLRDLYPWAYQALPLSPAMLHTALAVTAAIVAIAIARHRGVAAALHRLSTSEQMFLFLGSAILVGCFAVGQSFRYRAVFFLYVLPATTTLWSIRHSRLTTWLFGLSSIGIVCLLWSFYLVRPMQLAAAMLPGTTGPLIMATYFVGRELLWWMLISILMAAALRIAMRTEIAQFLARLLVRI